jgi:hypothetical protein
VNATAAKAEMPSCLHPAAKRYPGDLAGRHLVFCSECDGTVEDDMPAAVVISPPEPTEGVMDTSTIPAELRALPRWVRWKSVPAEPKPRKIPVCPSSPDCAETDNPATWGSFDEARAHVGQHGTCGIGFVFAKDGFFGVDGDDCLTDEGKPNATATGLLASFSTYAEVSPGGFGIHLLGRGSMNGHRGINKKKEGIEVYDSGRFFTMTGKVFPGAPPTIADCQPALDALIAKLDPPKPVPLSVSPRARKTDDHERLVERARAYVAKMPPGISGQGGHLATFSTALALVKGFSLDTGTALDLLREYNARCEPPWSEKELLHKIESAVAGIPPDGYIVERDEQKAYRPAPTPAPAGKPVGGSTAAPAEPKGSGDTPPDVLRVVLLDLPDVIRNIKRRDPISTGLPHLDALLGGGLSAGESFVTGGGPGSIKTTGMATIIEAQAGPKTAGYCIFFDEHYERVCRKLATRFGLKYDETEEPPESILDRLQGELARRDAILKIIWPRTGPSVEEIVGACLAATPAGRVPVFYLDHLHRMHTDTANDRDQTPAAMTKVVDACLRVTDHGGILYAISEVTKASLRPEAVRENPAGVFADTRAILSRFDVGFATVKLPTAPGSREVLAEVIATGKNRMGDGSIGFVNVLNLDTWGVTTRALDCVTSEADERKATAKGKAKKDQMDADDLLVLTYIPGHAVTQEIGCKKTDIEKGLPAESGQAISRDRVRDSLIRLENKKRILPHKWREPGKSGPEADYVREASK